MNGKWNIGRPRFACVGCARELGEGEEITSALSFNGLQFERRDYCPACWENVRTEDVYSYWRTAVPGKQEKPKPRAINVKVLDELFMKLLEEEDPSKTGVTFLVGMILVQKKILKYIKMEEEDGGQVVVLGRPKTDVRYRLADPGIDEEKMSAMKEDLKAILEQPHAGPGEEEEVEVETEP